MGSGILTTSKSKCSTLKVRPWRPRHPQRGNSRCLAFSLCSETSLLLPAPGIDTLRVSAGTFQAAALPSLLSLASPPHRDPLHPLHRTLPATHNLPEASHLQTCYGLLPFSSYGSFSLSLFVETPLEKIVSNLFPPSLSQSYCLQIWAPTPPRKLFWSMQLK